jgi:hypothetical protein
MTEKLAEMPEGTRLGGNPNTITSTLPPIDWIDEGFTERTVAAESSMTEKNGDVHETAAPLAAVADTMTAKEDTEVGELTRSVANVVEELDGSKYVLRMVAGISVNGACREKEALGDPPIGKFLTVTDIWVDFDKKYCDGRMDTN